MKKEILVERAEKILNSNIIKKEKRFIAYFNGKPVKGTKGKTSWSSELLAIRGIASSLERGKYVDEFDGWLDIPRDNVDDIINEFIKTGRLKIIPVDL